MHYHLCQDINKISQFDCIILPVFKTRGLSDIGQALNTKSKGQIERFIDDYLIDELGSTAILYEANFLSIKSIVFIHCGAHPIPSIQKFEQLIFQSIMYSSKHFICSLLIDIEGFSAAISSSNVLILAILASERVFYQFDEFKTSVKKKNNLTAISLYCKKDVSDAEQWIKQGVAISKGIAITKDLSNLPANHGTPTIIAEKIVKLSQPISDLKIQVLDKTEPIIKQMGAFLGVAKGSCEPCKFIVMHYQPHTPIDISPIVLVGKGVTFDTGGLSIKPAYAMEEMKFDMAGAASVVGILHTIATLQLEIPVVGLLPLTENLINGFALKPGDVLHTLSGQTVEIENTDAEGRLILADALTYGHRFHPSTIIDIATLTGAVVSALGEEVSGLMTNNPSLEKDLMHASQNSGDLIYPLPLWENYQTMIESNVADFSNLGKSGAGSITAACFLSRFIEKNIPWAHLDIAGTAYKPGRKKTATGRPVFLLVNYLLQKQIALLSEREKH